MKDLEGRQEMDKIQEAHRQLLADLLAEDGEAMQTSVIDQSGEKHCSRCEETLLESFDYCPHLLARVR